MLSEEELSLTKKQFSVFGVRSAKTGAVVETDKSGSRPHIRCPIRCRKVTSLLLYLTPGKYRKWKSIRMTLQDHDPMHAYDLVLLRPLAGWTDRGSVTDVNEHYELRPRF